MRFFSCASNATCAQRLKFHCVAGASEVVTHATIMQPRRILVNKKLGTSVWHVDNNMASNEELVLMAMLLLDEDDEDIKEKKRIWCRLLERNRNGHYSQLLPDLASFFPSSHDTPGFDKFMRMDFEHFKKLVDVLFEMLLKKDTLMRESIKPAEMCCLTLVNHSTLWSTSLE